MGVSRETMWQVKRAMEKTDKEGEMFYKEKNDVLQG